MIDLRRILVPTDFSPHARHALTYAAEFARRFNAELYLLHVFEDLTLYQPDAATIGPPIVPPLEELAAASRASLARFLAESNVSDLRVHAEVREGPAVDEIIDFAAEHDIDLIVLGTHGRGWLAHVLLGSTAEKVVRKAPCPVLTVRLSEHEFIKAD